MLPSPWKVLLASDGLGNLISMVIKHAMHILVHNTLHILPKQLTPRNADESARRVYSLMPSHSNAVSSYLKFI